MERSHITIEYRETTEKVKNFLPTEKPQSIIFLVLDYVDKVTIEVQSDFIGINGQKEEGEDYYFINVIFSLHTIMNSWTGIWYVNADHFKEGPINYIIDDVSTGRWSMFVRKLREELNNHLLKDEAQPQRSRIC